MCEGRNLGGYEGFMFDQLGLLNGEESMIPCWSGPGA